MTNLPGSHWGSWSSRLVDEVDPENDCGDPCGTDLVFLFNDDGNGPVRKLRQGVGFYKARPVIWTYY